MPFTLAHPAILFPLTRRNKFFSGTALIVGSMVPDVEFILQLQEAHTHAHSLLGILIFNIPVGIFLCWLFHALIKYFLIPNMPTFLRTRLQFIVEFDWLQYANKNKVMVFLSLCLGIASHFIWDAFTHETGWFVSLLPFLKGNVHFIGRDMTIYHALQIISSVLGLVALVYVVLRLPKKQSDHGTISWNYWLIFGLMATLLILVRFYLFEFRNGFWDIVIAVMGIAMYSTILSSLCLLLWLRKPRKRAPWPYSQKSRA